MIPSILLANDNGEDAGLIGFFHQFVTGGRAEGLELGNGIDVGGGDFESVAGRQFSYYPTGADNGKRASKPFGVESYFCHAV